MKSFFKFVLLSVFIIGSQSACFIAEYAQKQQERKEQAIKDLRELCSKLSPPKGFGKMSDSETFDIGKVVITQKYVSSDSCVDTGNYYKELIKSKGWDITKMEQYKTRGGLSTFDTDFRNREYVVTISCDDSSSIKKYDVYCSWGLK